MNRGQRETFRAETAARILQGLISGHLVASYADPMFDDSATCLVRTAVALTDALIDQLDREES